VRLIRFNLYLINATTLFRRLETYYLPSLQSVANGLYEHGAFVFRTLIPSAWALLYVQRSYNPW
jgi:hypothetical protein